MYRVAINYPHTYRARKDYIAWYFSFADSKEIAIKQVKELFVTTLTFRNCGVDITQFRFTAYDCKDVEFSHITE